LIALNEMTLKISDYSLWLYIIGFFYFIVIIGENFRSDLCDFLNESKFGIKNIFISIAIFISTFLHIDAIILLRNFGIEEIIIKTSEIVLIVIELLFVVAIGYWYLYVSIAVFVVFLIIMSIFEGLFGAIGGKTGALIGVGIVVLMYLPLFWEFILSILKLPFNIVECIIRKKDLTMY